MAAQGFDPRDFFLDEMAGGAGTPRESYTHLCKMAGPQLDDFNFLGLGFFKWSITVKGWLIRSCFKTVFLVLERPPQCFRPKMERLNQC